MAEMTCRCKLKKHMQRKRQRQYWKLPPFLVQFTNDLQKAVPQSLYEHDPSLQIFHLESAHGSGSVRIKLGRQNLQCRLILIPSD